MTHITGIAEMIRKWSGSGGHRFIPELSQGDLESVFTTRFIIEVMRASERATTSLQRWKGT